ncbi:hypothetical protein ACIBCT_16635 [Streptosporangium sp. NPDC050855]|uniref:hypothetical protein n=1 Tax=Streptosporangium sp. NPDC050855 TaxID=3366194 RepID=UPI0037884AB9
MTRFAFDVDPAWRTPLSLIGVGPGRAFAEVGEGVLSVRFGPWSLRTPVANVSGTEVTGPYAAWKVIGPHLSLVDRGVTFGTNARRGLCVRFRTPVPALVPGGFLTHPGATLTVSAPEELAEAIERAREV